MHQVQSKSVLSDYQKNFSSQRKQKQESLRFGMHSVYISLLCIISGLIFYYVILLNTNATKGYQIRDLENIQRTLLIEEQNLDVKIAELESLNRILKNEMQEIMEDVQDTNHIVIRDDVQYVYNY